MNEKIPGKRPCNGVTFGQPFPAGTAGSENFRIPCLVTLKDGTIAAAADVRWDSESDGGGMDLIFSRSEDDGKTWQYTFPAYLGDNGDRYSPSSSTIMDPLLITDGEKLWLFADIFRAGYSLTTACTDHAFSDIRSGFDGEGHPLLTEDGEHYDHYLADGKIFKDGKALPGIEVDGSFDIYENGSYAGNIFFADAPFRVMPVSFIFMTTSGDGGKSWSGMKLIPVKEEGQLFTVIGPGRGIVTSDGTLVFSAYDGKNVYLVWSEDGGESWKKVRSGEAGGESQPVELPDGNIRLMVRTGGINQICYIDFAKTADGWMPGPIVKTGVPNFSQCMISALRVTRNGKEYLLTCCPSDAGGGDWAGRFNGKVYVFALDENCAMRLEKTLQLNDSFFAYSCMAELPDGSIGILYEDDCIGYRAGNYFGERSHIVWKTLSPFSDEN